MPFHCHDGRRFIFCSSHYDIIIYRYTNTTCKHTHVINNIQVLDHFVMILIIILRQVRLKLSFRLKRTWWAKAQRHGVGRRVGTAAHEAGQAIAARAQTHASGSGRRHNRREMVVRPETSFGTLATGHRSCWQSSVGYRRVVLACQARLPYVAHSGLVARSCAV